MAKPGFYNENSGRAYPFVEESIGRELEGDVGITDIRRLPFDTIVDCGFLFGQWSVLPAVSGVSAYLSRVRRLNWFTFEFWFNFTQELPDPGLQALSDSIESGLQSGKILQEVASARFLRHLNDEPYTTTRTLLRGFSTGVCGNTYAGEGFLVTGDLTALAELLPLCPGEPPGLSGGPDKAVVEPALLQNLFQLGIRDVAYGNLRPVQAQPPAECRPYIYDDRLLVGGFCVEGDVLFEEGYNAEISVSEQSNTITLGARLGGGKGFPCTEVPAIPGEDLPRDPNTGTTSVHFSGGPSCNEVLRTVNGIPGPNVTLRAGRGVTLVEDPSTHLIQVNIDLTDLAVSGCALIDPTESPVVVTNTFPTLSTQGSQGWTEANLARAENEFPGFTNTGVGAVALAPCAVISTMPGFTASGSGSVT